MSRVGALDHAAGHVMVRALPVAMLAFLAAACSTDPPTEPLFPVFDVTIAGAPVDSVVLLDASLQLTATAFGQAGELLEGRGIQWSSTATDVASVTGEGRVRTHETGEFAITATSEAVSRALVLCVREGTTVPGQGNAREVTLLDGLLRLDIPVGSAPGGTVVHARAAVDWPPDARLLEGSVVEIGPEGTELAQPFVVGVSFVPTEIPAAERDQLRLYGLDAGGQWVELPQPRVDLTEFFVEAGFMRLTTVAIFRPVTF